MYKREFCLLGLWWLNGWVERDVAYWSWTKLMQLCCVFCRLWKLSNYWTYASSLKQ